jgi:hypothetical protein
VNFIPTAEQALAIDAMRSGANLVGEAGAGSGKTTTLNAMARAIGRPRLRGVYIGFNKVTAQEAAAKFPRYVDCRTGHSLAYRSHGAPLRHKLPHERRAQSPRDVAAILGITPAVLSVTGSAAPAVVPIPRLAWAARETVDRFCRSAAPELTVRHVAVDALPDGVSRRQYDEIVLTYARRAWADLANPDGALRMPHDVYRKLWALSRPVLRADFVMLDEAQDTAPVLADVVRSQNCQQIAVGDSSQQLYAWAGAVDALANWGADAHHFTLSQSWRFGQAIADEANNWLTLLGATLRITGNPALDSTVTTLDRADAILCRTNIGAVASVLEHLDAGRQVFLVGGPREIELITLAAAALRRGQRTEHPELCVFATWDEVRRAASQEDADGTLKMLVGVIERFGVDAILGAMRSLASSEDRAEVVVSTGHKAKGREWGSVRIFEDFVAKSAKADPETGLAIIPREAMMLNYVAVTRAKLALDRGPLAYVDDYLTPVEAP